MRLNKPTLGVVVTSAFMPLDTQMQTAAINSLGTLFRVKVYLPKTQPSQGSIIRAINMAAKENIVVLSYMGGWNQTELMLDFDKLSFRRENIFVGRSDNTLLVAALCTQNICRTLYGPGFYQFATEVDLANELTRNLYTATSTREQKLRIDSSKGIVLQSGSGDGRLIGGNNYTFDMLPGTVYSPDFAQPFILFMEGEDILRNPEDTWKDFARNIDALMLIPGAQTSMRGLIIGRFPNDVVKTADMEKFCKSRSYLTDIPVLTDFPCGHDKKSTDYLPIGENITLIC